MNNYQCEQCQKPFQRRMDGQKSSYARWQKTLCFDCIRPLRAEATKGSHCISPTHKKKMLEARRLRYPPLTITCKYCHHEFKVPYGQRDRSFCGRSCQSRAVTRTDIRKTTLCLMCQKPFRHYGERVVCSNACNAHYMSKMRIGDNNPSVKNCKRETKTCLHCKQPFTFTRSNLHQGQTRVFCSLTCSHQLDIKGLKLGRARNPYPREWTKTKEIIRSRDGGLCILCGKDQKGCNERHPVHHIDYNPKNLDHQNLLTLCKTCHNATHNGRAFWEILFTALMSGSKLVKKGWGVEIHVTNNSQYCLKYLVFFKHKRFSYHFHHLKKELWHCLWGTFECILGQPNGDKQHFYFKQGDKIELEPGIPHQLQALRNCIITEVSTSDYPEDSIRIEKGD